MRITRLFLILFLIIAAPNIVDAGQPVMNETKGSTSEPEPEPEPDCDYIAQADYK
jgi:hypothetical protein